MSDQSADNSENQLDRAEQTPKPTSSELVAVSDVHREPLGETQADMSASKEITLQRLTPHSSWDGAFGDSESFGTKAFDAKAFEQALREPAASARRPLPIAAMIAITVTVGAISGAAATFGLAHFTKNDQAKVAERGHALDQALAKVDAELAAVKANAENASKTNSARLAKLNEALDKFKAAEVTGSIAPPLPAALPSPAPSISAPATQFARLPVVDGWVLREVADGGALVEGRMGTYQVFAGDPLPGVGRIDAIRRQDGRWVVVTSRGLIVAR